jgi:hypothetical protein
MWWIALPFVLLGGAMVARGTIYTLAPNSGIAKKRQQKNLRAGFSTDMLSFGRRVRRLGALLLLIGLALIGWQRSYEVERAGEPPAATP